MNPRVLVVDDDPSIRVLVRLSLEGTYEIEEASDGQEACDIISERPSAWSAMVLDLGMPRKSGFEVLEHVRAIPEAEGMPVVVLTAMSDRQSKLDAYVGGGDVFVTKPFDPDALLKTVRDLIGRSRSGLNADRLGKLINLQE